MSWQPNKSSKVNDKNDIIKRFGPFYYRLFIEGPPRFPYKDIVRTYGLAFNNGNTYTFSINITRYMKV